MTTADILREARGLAERGWWGNCLGLNVEGQRVEPDSPDTVKWSLLGALYKVCERERVSTRAVVSALLEQTKFPIHSWECRPGRTQDEVLAAFDRAIEAAE